MSDNWKSLLYNGLLTESGKTPRVYSGMITKPIAHEQTREVMTRDPSIESSNMQSRGLQHKHKNKTSTHRAMSFLPQE